MDDNFTIQFREGCFNQSGDSLSIFDAVRMADEALAGIIQSVFGMRFHPFRPGELNDVSFFTMV